MSTVAGRGMLPHSKRFCMG